MSERRRRGEGLSAFQKLETQAKRLERSILLLIVMIAVAPPLFYTAMQLRGYRARAAVHADHVAQILLFYGQMPGASMEGLGRHLRAELEHDDLGVVQVWTGDGSEIVRLGELPRWALPDAVELTLPAAAAPFARLRVRMVETP